MINLDEPIYVIPDEDGREHVLEGTCWCRPKIETVDPTSGQPYSSALVIHRNKAERARDAS